MLCGRSLLHAHHSSIRLGALTHLSAAELTENLEASLPKIIGKHVKGGWENVQSIDIKTGSSVALPVWTSKLTDRWVGMAEPAQPTSDVEGIDGDEDDKEEKEEGKRTLAKASKESVSAKTKTKSAGSEKKQRSSISAQSVAPKGSKKAKRAV